MTHCRRLHSRSRTTLPAWRTSPAKLRSLPRTPVKIRHFAAWHDCRNAAVHHASRSTAGAILESISTQLAHADRLFTRLGHRASGGGGDSGQRAEPLSTPEAARAGQQPFTHG